MEKIIVIKIGSSVLMTKRNKIDEFRISHVAQQILTLREKGIEVILVVSGAVAYGSNFINLLENNDYLKQLAAGIGQAHVISVLSSAFLKKKIYIAQVLLTKNDLQSDQKRQKIKNMLKFYVQAGFIPIINENDVLDLNSFGGNDLLAAEVSELVQAYTLIILSTKEGSTHGVGGGETKQQAIDMLAKRNIEAFIVNGKAKDILLRTVL